MPYPKSDGRVSVDGTDYYIKQLSIKGPQGQRMSLDDYIALMQERARSSERQRMMSLRRRHPQAR